MIRSILYSGVTKIIKSLLSLAETSDLTEDSVLNQSL